VPPAPVRLVTYAWGRRYIDRLLDFALASVLAPGNLPALARAFDCTVVVVTEKNLFDYVRAHPIARQVEAVCPLRLVALDDLIAEPWQYGFTVAYSLFRGFADLGAAMTDTYMLFLNADFIVADGSYERLVPHILEGERVLLSPSYCVVEEQVRPLLLERRDPTTGSLAFPPRELAQLIIDHRHNTIRAKTANQHLVHFEYMDQFYWLVDEHTLLGHQMPISLIGMRPEEALTDLTTFWDWGTVYDFCPSRQLMALGDSDEFLMMEMRAEDTYCDSIRPGARSPRATAAKLATYITQYQVDSVRFPLTVHSRELPAGVEAARASLRAYAEKILGLLPTTPIDHRNHSHWDYHKSYFQKYQATQVTRAEQTRLKAEMSRLEDEYRSVVESVTQRYEPKLQALREALARLEPDGQSLGASAPTPDRSEPGQNTTNGSDKAQSANGRHEEPQTATAAPAAVPTAPRAAGAFKRLSRCLFGSFPYTRPWHPLHLPYRRLSLALKCARERGTSSILAVCEPQSALACTVVSLPGTHAWMSVSDLQRGDAVGVLSGSPSFDLCIIELASADVAQTRDLYRAVLPHMDRHGTVVIHGSNLELASRKFWERTLIQSQIGNTHGVDVHYSGSWAGVRAVKLLRLAYRIRSSQQAGSGYYQIPLLAGVAAAIVPLALAARAQERGTARTASSIPLECTGVTIEIGVGAEL
jgi:hypothetical protein